ncbi:hypothetical protein [Paraburkholderia sediminicola]|uniref:hypothetical protein n=1 Tax=Paraburkholderia sediminicola TaxID=458836 RepID=UPI0038B92282
MGIVSAIEDRGKWPDTAARSNSRPLISNGFILSSLDSVQTSANTMTASTPLPDRSALISGVINLPPTIRGVERYLLWNAIAFKCSYAKYKPIQR